jgi:hypothetical protein
LDVDDSLCALDEPDGSGERRELEREVNGEASKCVLVQMLRRLDCAWVQLMMRQMALEDVPELEEAEEDEGYSV